MTAIERPAASSAEPHPPGRAEPAEADAGDDLAAYARLAQQALAPGLWAYLSGGSETEAALRRNRQALEATALVPRVLADVAAVDHSARLFGHRLRLPVLLAPVGSVDRLHAQGPAGVRRAAEDHGVPYCIGSALPGASHVAASERVPAFFQLYVDGDEAWLRQQCEQAGQRGYKAVILTVDAPVFPVRRRDVETGNHAAGRSRGATSPWRQALGWAEIERLVAAMPGLPIIVKGVQDARDASRACEAGAAAVYASNHGGRQFDQGPGMLDLLPSLRDAVASRVPLIVDGGFASANDVIKALVAGADLVGLGRAHLYPFAAGGASLLGRYLESLSQQLATNMALLGCRSIAELREIRAFCAPREGWR